MEESKPAATGNPPKKVSQRHKRILAVLDTRFLEQLLGV